MLKIKDDVDLKELEKFGFQYRIGNYREEWCIIKPLDPKPHWSWHRTHRTHITVATVHKLDRVLTHSSSKDMDDLLFDLITAGLVEKVGE